MGMSRLERGDLRCRLKVPILSSSASFAASCCACCVSENREVGLPGDSVSGRSAFMPRTDRDIERVDFVDLTDFAEGLVSGGWGLEKTVGTFMVYMEFRDLQALMLVFLFS